MTLLTEKNNKTESLSGNLTDSYSQLSDQSNHSDYPSSVNVYSSDNVHVGPKNIYNGNVSITHIVLPDNKSSLDLTSSQEQLEKLPEHIGNGDYISNKQGKIYSISNGKLSSATPNIRIEPKNEKSPKFYNKRFMICSSIVVSATILFTVLYVMFFSHLPKHKQHPTTNVNSSESNKEGVLTLIDRNQWNALPTEAKLENMSHPIDYVLVEHTATTTCFSLIKCSNLVRSIQDYHRAIDDIGDDIGYNFLIGGNGFVFEGRGWDTVGAHARGWNRVSVGVAFIGDYETDIPNHELFNALHSLLREGVKQKKLTANYKIVDVSQVQITLSPGRNVIKLIKKDPHYYSIDTRSFVNDPSKN